MAWEAKEGKHMAAPSTFSNSSLVEQVGSADARCDDPVHTQLLAFHCCHVVVAFPV